MSQVYMSPEHARWARVMEYLVGLSVDYNRDVPMPWRFQAPVRGERPDYAARLRELEATVQAEIEQAIADTIARGQSRPLSDLAHTLLGVRIDACIQFVSLLATRDGFLTCPQLPIEQIAKWVLLDWWRERGATYATAFDPEHYP